MVVPVTIAIIVVLFSIQRFGTHRIGRVFGPVMVFWFAVIAVAGLGRVVAHPEIVKALLAELRGRVLRPPLRHRLHLRSARSC